MAHPYHYTGGKNLIQRLIDIGLPVGLFFLYFNFYNFGKFTPSEMVKTTGLLAISLLAITLLVGPIARFLPFLDVLKAHRKFWGIMSFLILAVHIGLVIIFYFKLDLSVLTNVNGPKFSGFLAGVLAFLILFLVTFSSHSKFVKHLDPKTWKLIQTTSYIALFLAVAHFYLMEQVNGVLVIKRSLGMITLWFAAAVIAVRILVLLLPKKK